MSSVPEEYGVTKTYEWYKAQGICPKCRRNKIEDGKSCCRACLDKINDRQKKRIREGVIKKRYWDRRNKGVCVVCGRPLCIGSNTRCGYHQAQADRYNGKKRDPELYTAVDGTPLNMGISHRESRECDGDCFNCKFEDCIRA